MKTKQYVGHQQLKRGSTSALQRQRVQVDGQAGDARPSHGPALKVEENKINHSVKTGGTVESSKKDRGR